MGGRESPAMTRSCYFACLPLPSKGWVAIYIAILLLVPSRVFGQPSVDTPEESGPAPEVVDLEEGLPAPFSGLLLTEARFLVYAGQQVRITELEGRLEIRERLLRETADELAEVRARIGEETEAAREAAEPGFWSRNSFWFGAVVGLVATGALVWGAVEVLRSDGGT